MNNSNVTKSRVGRPEFCVYLVHSKGDLRFIVSVIQGACGGLVPATEGSLQILGRIRYLLCHQPPKLGRTNPWPRFTSVHTCTGPGTGTDRSLRTNAWIENIREEEKRGWKGKGWRVGEGGWGGWVEVGWQGVHKGKENGFDMDPVHNKVISGFQALRRARAPVAGLEPATEKSLQISGRIRWPLCHRRPPLDCKAKVRHTNTHTDTDTDTDTDKRSNRLKFNVRVLPVPRPYFG
ncbi:hypothetical protein PoB_004040800 [Plakobranchus ocellatus]|uniref:Uncharacterized protein n=1 Tax=Plakobranchus ocellatus TaxID=259542 RepID=A0AAV4B571_9GAST|nr:hypothetical protein PoB_004040800 [Plakobranchus ocellatus]